MYPYYLGTNAPYPHDSGANLSYPEMQVRPANPPEGYEPFYINHLSREGTAVFPSQSELTYLIYVLTDHFSPLTTEGHVLLSYLKELQELEQNQYGSLQGSDNSNVKDIARRMYHNYPSIFGKQMYSVSTYVQSTIDTMLSFMEELFRYTPRELALMSSGGRPDPLLRFFDLNIAYQKYKESEWWIPLIDHYYNTSYDASVITEYFFLQPLPANIQTDFASTLFRVLAATYNIQPAAIPPLLNRYFSPSAKRNYWLYNNAYEFYEQGPTLPGITLTGDIAFPLLEDFLTSGIRAAESGDISANFRFAHANTVISFTNLLMLDCCSRQTDYPPEIPVLWRNYQVAPLAANICWIFYRHKLRRTILVKMTYNEQDILFPFHNGRVFVSWEEVREFYSSLLNQLPINRDLSLVEQVSTYPFSS